MKLLWNCSCHLEEAIENNTKLFMKVMCIAVMELMNIELEARINIGLGSRRFSELQSL